MQSTIHPDGHIACAVSTLERLGCLDEVAEIKRLLIERLYFREQTVTLGAELVLQTNATQAASDQARQAWRIARQCLQNWRSLALIQQSRDELAKIDAVLAQYPSLRADA